MNEIHLALSPSSSARRLRNHGEELLLSVHAIAHSRDCRPQGRSGLLFALSRDGFLPQATAPPCLQLSMVGVAIRRFIWKPRHTE
jgi:hypothetical protein